MATTENMRVLTDQQTSTVASNVQGVQQARRLANASTVSPTVRHQRSVQADPNKLSKSLESIGNAVGNIAQDTYSLNNALVDEMVSDDISMMVTGLDKMDKSLKPGESRDNIIKTAGSYRAELMAKKGDFGGNADMQARYREKFINPSAAQTMAYVKKWQKEEHLIIGERLVESTKDWMLNVMPYIGVDPMTGKQSEGGRAIATEEFNKQMRSLNDYGVEKASLFRLNSAKAMTSNLNSDVDSNTQMYYGSGQNALISPEGVYNKEQMKNIFEKHLYVFATVKEDEKGNQSLDFKTSDAAVKEEVAKYWNSLHLKVKQGKTTSDTNNYKILEEFVAEINHTGKKGESLMTLSGQNITRGLYQEEAQKELIRRKVIELGLPIDEYTAAKVTGWKRNLYNENNELKFQISNSDSGVNIPTTLDDETKRFAIKTKVIQTSEKINELRSMSNFDAKESTEVTEKRIKLYDDINAELRSQNVESSAATVKAMMSAQMTNPQSHQAYREWKENKPLVALNSAKTLMHHVQPSDMESNVMMLVQADYQMFEDKHGDKTDIQYEMSNEKYQVIRDTAYGILNESSGKMINMKKKDIEEYNAEYSWLPSRDRDQLKNRSRIYVTSSNGADFDKMDNYTANKYSDKSDKSFFGSNRKIMIQDTALVRSRSEQPSDSKWSTNFVPYIDNQIKQAVVDKEISYGTYNKSKTYGYTLEESPFNTGEFMVHVLDENGKAIKAGITVNIGAYEGNK